MLRKIITTLITTSAAVTLLVGLTGCGPTEPPSTAKAAQSTPKAKTTPRPRRSQPAEVEQSPSHVEAQSHAEAQPKRKPGVTATVNRWVDGDTVDTSRGTIRLIGVDTPEKGRCGAATATKAARRWAPVGSTVRLVNPSSVVDTDRYGRSLRYVVRGEIDVSKAQIVKGAKARYDSTDGYQWHPRQASYHAADRAHRDYHCSSKPSRVPPEFDRADQQVGLPQPGSDQGQRLLDDLPHALEPLLRRHHARAVLQHRRCGRSGRVPSSKGLTGSYGSDLRRPDCSVSVGAAWQTRLPTRTLGLLGARVDGDPSSPFPVAKTSSARVGPSAQPDGNAGVAAPPPDHAGTDCS